MSVRARRTRVKAAIVVGIAGIAAISIAACGGGSGSSAASGTKTLTMGTEPWIGYGPWWIVASKGFDKQHGFTLKLTNFTQDSDLAAAFASGKVEAENLSLNAGLTHLAAGQPVTFPLFMDISRTADAILGGPKVKSVADLRGKTVAYEEGTTSDVLLRYALSQNGMTINDVKPVHLPASQAGSAAIAGRVDAAVTYEPYLTAALKKGQGFREIYTAGQRPGLISDMLAINNEFAKSNPQLMVHALQAWNDAVNFYAKHTSQAQAIIAKHVGASPQELATTFKGVQLFNLSQSQDFLRSQFKQLAPTIEKLLKQEGTLDGNPDIVAAATTRYGDMAQK